MIADTVSRALSYPYRPVTNAVTLDGDGIETALDEVSEGDLHSAGQCCPVIACGSNRAPEQLRRKFKGYELGSVHLSPAMLRGHDCVYSAHITSYGSVPATLYESPGVEVEVAIVWLNGHQLQRMHETESLGQNYAFERLMTPGMTTQFGLQISEAFHYRSLRGLLGPKGEPVALAEVTAINRPRVEWSQSEVLHYIYDLLGPKLGFDMFVYQLANDPLFRANVTAKLPKMR